MPKMRVIYSCVVDGSPKFVMQAFNLVLSLRGVGVAPERILVNLTPSAFAHRRRFEAMGVQVRDTVFFADGEYCNKVAQLRNAPDGADVVVCCDTDILFVNNIEPMLAENRGIILGKTVDFANPPIERLRAAITLVDANLRLKETQSDLDKQPTFLGNFNGGLYVLPAEHISIFREAWERYTDALFKHPQTHAVLGKFAWHIDQIAFCCALNSLGLPHGTLPIEFNYPVHCQVPEDREASTGQLRIIHYHQAIDENWMPTTAQIRHPGLKNQVTEAVEALRSLWCLEGSRDDAVCRASQHFAFVMGFHRSGTSLLTAGCQHLGYSIGTGPQNAKNMIDNPTGYFENRRLVKLNEAIMRELESEWDDILFSFDGRQAEIQAKFLVPIQRFIEEEFLCFPADRYVLKDPRTMQTYGVWRGAFRSIGLDTPEIIFLCRNPLECAESQAARYKAVYVEQHDPAHFFGRELLETCLLWYAYNVRFLMTLEEERIIFIRFNDLIDMPDLVLNRIAKWANLNPDAVTPAAFTSAFLDKKLRHHRRDRAELQAATRLYPQIADLYVQLDALAGRDFVPSATIRSIVERHRDSYAELLHYAFLGRLYTVPRLKWQWAAVRRGTDASNSPLVRPTNGASVRKN